MKRKIEAIEKYFKRVQYASNESVKKECLKDLLLRLFDSDPEMSGILDKMSLGAEKTVFSIPLPSRSKTGFADTQYNNVIIEFEKDLGKTGAHAIDQLREYLAGNWRSGDSYDFILIATDGIRWQILAPEYSLLTTLKRPIELKDVSLKLVYLFELTARNFEDFFFFLDRFLFRTIPLPATLSSITTDFGESSSVFINSMLILGGSIPSIEDRPILATAYSEWKKFLSIAYGKFQDSQELFFVHTYLSVFAKLLAYRFLSEKVLLDRDELKAVLTGEIFRNLNVERFVENDFYHWVAEEEYFELLQPLFRGINRRLSEYNFQDVKEDILKGVYQELINTETRHALGEYYTPDWLCERIMESLPLEESSHILDPACGSGSFLRASIVRMRTLYPTLSASDLAAQIVGIDIHPLSVQISKTTLLLAMAGKIKKARKPVKLNVYLANALLVPTGSAELFGHTFKVSIDGKSYPLEMSIFHNDTDFDKAISLCDRIAEYNPKRLTAKEFSAHLKPDLEEAKQVHLDNFYSIYLALRKAKEQGRDSIWKFILQNLYKPVFLRHQFDFIVGNPPWLTYSDVTNASYQADLLELSDKYCLTPVSKANMPHLEIAAIFLSHAGIYFGKEGGKIVFVLPRSFISADQHDNTRSASAIGFRLTGVWDLKDVQPLFKVPACVFAADIQRGVTGAKRSLPKEGIEGFVVNGRLKEFNTHWDVAKDLLTFSPTRWYYSTLSKQTGARSALTTKKIENGNGENYYAKQFKQGATIVPRSFYFVKVDMQIEGGLQDRILNCKTLPLPEAKEPWRSISISGFINSKYLFRTALSKNILPFALFEPVLVLLPIEIIGDDTTEKRVLIRTRDQIFKAHEIDTAFWFKKAEEYWEELKTQRNSDKEIGMYDYLNWQGKLTQQNMDSKFLVLYTASAKNANSAIYERKTLDFPFIVESKAYWYPTDSLDEANYLTSLLNSNYANEVIKHFQSRGLFGPRDVHKSILAVPFPRFSEKDARHMEISALGRKCAIKAKRLLSAHKGSDLEGHPLGRIRSEIRVILKPELEAIDRLVVSILGK